MNKERAVQLHLQCQKLNSNFILFYFIANLLIYSFSKIAYTPTDYLKKTVEKIQEEYNSTLEIRPFGCHYFEALAAIRYFIRNGFYCLRSHDGQVMVIGLQCTCTFTLEGTLDPAFIFGKNFYPAFFRRAQIFFSIFNTI